jgi:hypothetical protein
LAVFQVSHRVVAFGAGVLLTAAILVAPAPARGSTQRARDPADTAGPLDIESATEGQRSPGEVRLELNTWDRFGRKALGGPDEIAFAFYEHGYPYRWVYVRREGKALKAFVERDEGDVLATEPVTGPSRRAVEVHIPTGLLDDPAGYEWAALTSYRNGGVCARICIDAIPSSYQFKQTETSLVHPRLLDLTAPTIRLLQFPDPSTQRSRTLTYPVKFSVRDTGGAHLRGWSLQRKRVGGARWRELRTGTKTGRNRIRLQGKEGETYAHRVIAVDRQGNRRRSTRALISVPLDDTNASLASSFVGPWRTDQAASLDFRETLHTSSDASARFVYPFTGTRVVLVGPGLPGVAAVSVDGNLPEQIDLSLLPGRRRMLFARTVPSGDHTLSVSIVSGTVGIDGVAVRPPISASSAGQTISDRIETFDRETTRSPPDNEGLDCMRTPLDPTLCRGETVRRASSARYNDSWRGWPVRPLHKQHPIQGSFLDPRPAGFHFGIDISVRDDRPEKGAPAGRTHRVYAVEGGSVYNLFDTGLPCRQRRVWVGHFAYYHVDATVAAGAAVAPGQMIGWTCKGEWHIHLSELTSAHALVDPLHPGGKLAPYRDAKPPIVGPFALFTPAANFWTAPHGAMWSPGAGRAAPGDRLHGVVDVRVRARDPQSFRGWLISLPYLNTDLHPYRVFLTVSRASDGATVLRREISGPVFPYSLPENFHYAPGTRANQRSAVCYHFHRQASKAPVSCPGRYWIHAFGTSSSPYWDTRTMPNGRYRVRVTAWDASGHKASRAVDVRLANP